MNLGELKTLIGGITNDPNHDRYSESDIERELDTTQDKWNVHAKIIRDTVTLTTVDGTREYALSGLTGTPIDFNRVTHKGIELHRREKSWFDLFYSHDWTEDNGTPKNYFISITDPDSQVITVQPTPEAEDAGANLVVEYIKRHTPMTSDSDVPFNGNTLLVPYHWGIAYDAAARLLSRDPSPENTARASDYNSQANNVLAEVIQTFKAQEREEPMRLRPTRVWPVR